VLPARPGILLVTELFPPSVGGSAELLANTYQRVESVATTVLTDRSGTKGRPGQRLSVRHASLRTRQWGLMHPAGLANHLHVARHIWTSSRHGIGAVHCGRALPEGLSAMLAHAAGAPPYLCWAHGEELAYMRSSRELRWLAAQVFRRSRAVVANSQNTADLLAPFGVEPAKIHVVRPGVDAGRFRPDLAGAARLRRELAPDNHIVCLTVGRLQKRKGHDVVIEALAALGTAASHVTYVIVGDGEERVRLESLVRERGLGSAVVFKGRVDGAELASYYAAADIFVHPNRIEGNDFEGFGIVFLEAAACGLPVIAGNSGGVPEAVVHGETGLLVSGTDVGELKTALLALLTAPEKRRALGHAGRSRAATQFTWQHAAARIEAVHEAVVAQ
jgi:phosphatidylinositol alpha-1,6-mannosyltransferase